MFNAEKSNRYVWKLKDIKSHCPEDEREEAATDCLRDLLRELGYSDVLEEFDHAVGRTSFSAARLHSFFRGGR
jgi:hypothetical protein